MKVFWNTKVKNRIYFVTKFRSVFGMDRETCYGRQLQWYALKFRHSDLCLMGRHSKLVLLVHDASRCARTPQNRTYHGHPLVCEFVNSDHFEICWQRSLGFKRISFPRSHALRENKKLQLRFFVIGQIIQYFYSEPNTLCI